MFVFASCDLRDSLRDLAELLQIHAHCPRIVGASAGGLIGEAREEEGASGFSLLALRADGTEFCSVDIPAEETGPHWNNVRRLSREGSGGWIVIGHPARISTLTLQYPAAPLAISPSRPLHR